MYTSIVLSSEDSRIPNSFTVLSSIENNSFTILFSVDSKIPNSFTMLQNIAFTQLYSVDNRMTKSFIMPSLEDNRITK